MAATVGVDPWAALRTRRYIGLLVLAAALGVPVSLAAYWFLKFISLLQGWTYTSLPNSLGFDGAPTWWPVVPLVAAGLIVGLTVRYFPGKGGEVPVDGFKAGGLPVPVNLPGIAIAAAVSIGLGAVVGPEGPLVALGGGLAYLIVWLVKRDLPAQAGVVIAVAGSFAAISTLLGNPLAGAFLLLEASGLGGPMAAEVLVPGLVGAGVGALIFVGLDSLTGYGTFSLAIPHIPPAVAPTIAEFGWAIAIGIAAALVCWAIRNGALRLRPIVEHSPVIMTTAVGLATAGLAIAYALGTNKSASDVLFSGQSALPNLVDNSATFSVGALLVLIACKGLAYTGCLCSFRGGPTFPAMYLGAAGGIALSHLPGLALIPAVGIGIGAMTVGMLKLPLAAVLLTTLFLGTDGFQVMPLVIIAVAVSFVITQRLIPPSLPVPATEPEQPATTGAASA
jgi:chloride channel protein, CIC family